MSPQLNAQLAGWSGVRELLGQLRNWGVELEAFIGPQLDALEGMRRELAERQRRIVAEGEAWLVEKGRLQDAQVQLAESDRQRCELNEQLHAARAELQSAQDALGNAQVELEQARVQREAHLVELQSAPNKAELAAFTNEKRELSEKLETAHGQIARLAHAGVEIGHAREQLAEVRDRASALEGELTSARQELDVSESRVRELQTQLAASTGSEDPAMRERLHGMELERARLEWELESVRNRAAELAEQSSQEKRRIAEERAEWAGQLKQLRRTLERQSQTVAPHQGVAEPMLRTAQSAPAAHAHATTAHASAAHITAPFAAQDPVLGSIMAQFEMLQKDLVRRRSNGAAKRQDVA